MEFFKAIARITQVVACAGTKPNLIKRREQSEDEEISHARLYLIKSLKITRAIGQVIGDQ